MLKLGGGVDFAREPFGTQGRRQLGAEHLDRHPPMVLWIFSEVHRRHSTRSQLANQAVPVGENGRDVLEGCGHVLLSP